jgi:hypothetical protein
MITLTSMGNNADTLPDRICCFAVSEQAYRSPLWMPWFKSENMW